LSFEIRPLEPSASRRLAGRIDDPRDLEKEVPKLHLVESVDFLTMPDLVGRLSKSSVSGAMYRVMCRLPFYRHLIRHLRYEFSGDPAATAAP
jgi:hypothetical protein